jgi:hypothetical protein
MPALLADAGALDVPGTLPEMTRLPEPAALRMPALTEPQALLVPRRVDAGSPIPTQTPTRKTRTRSASGLTSPIHATAPAARDGRADISGADISGADISGADISGKQTKARATDLADARGGPREPEPRGMSPGRWWLVPMLMIAALLLPDSHNSADPPPAAPQTSAMSNPNPIRLSASHASVGMPVPGGDAPVWPVRVVLEASAEQLPLTEQRELARWVADTQHRLTRIRIERDGALSAPLSASALETRITATGGAERKRTWLRRGARRGIPGALLAIDAASATLAGPHLRSASIILNDIDRRTQRAVAAKIARQIMISSNQREVGTTTTP